MSRLTVILSSFILIAESPFRPINVPLEFNNHSIRKINEIVNKNKNYQEAKIDLYREKENSIVY